MKIAVLTEAGATPITSAELADILDRKLGLLSTKGQIRKALAAVESEVRQLTTTLGPEHR